MNVGVSEISDEHARALVRKALGITTSGNFNSGSNPALCAEVLRATLWAFWSTEQRPVYVTRLLGTASRMMLPWLQNEGQNSPTIAEQLRSALEELEIIGDLAALPGGWWAPTPLRSVHLPTIGRHIILGGMPTRLLPVQLLEIIERSGVVRLAQLHRLKSDLNIETITEQDWLRMPSSDLATWTRTVLDATELAAAGDLSVEVYSPATALRGADQYHRWQPNVERLPDGLYLARQRKRRGGVAYYIVRIVAGRIDTLGTPVLGDGDVRRLMYGLDMLAGNPVRVWAEQRRDRWRVKLRSALPQPEQRLFIAIGREQVREDGRYYPRWWDIAIQYVPKVRDALLALGIQIEQR